MTISDIIALVGLGFTILTSAFGVSWYLGGRLIKIETRVDHLASRIDELKARSGK